LWIKWLLRNNNGTIHSHFLKTIDKRKPTLNARTTGRRPIISY
jgi:hypothetical protein